MCAQTHEAQFKEHRHVPGHRIAPPPPPLPCSIDDSVARADWGWKHDYDLDAMTRDMLIALAPSLGVPVPATLSGTGTRRDK